jgi:hypothetical protein
MTLHMAATGEFPFERGVRDADAPAADRFPQLVRVAPRLDPVLPSTFAEIVAACLDPLAAGRPAPAEVYFALQGLSADGDTSVRPSAGGASTTATAADDRRRFEAALRAKRGRRTPKAR